MVCVNVPFSRRSSRRRYSCGTSVQRGSIPRTSAATRAHAPLHRRAPSCAFLRPAPAARAAWPAAAPGATARATRPHSVVYSSTFTSSGTCNNASIVAAGLQRKLARHACQLAHNRSPQPLVNHCRVRTAVLVHRDVHAESARAPRPARTCSSTSGSRQSSPSGHAAAHFTEAPVHRPNFNVKRSRGKRAAPGAVAVIELNHRFHFPRRGVPRPRGCNSNHRAIIAFCLRKERKKQWKLIARKRQPAFTALCVSKRRRVAALQTRWRRCPLSQRTGHTGARGARLQFVQPRQC